MEVDSQKRSDYLLLIQARLNGWSVVPLTGNLAALNVTKPVGYADAQYDLGYMYDNGRGVNGR